MIVTLVGMPGTGKTSVGKLLSKRLKVPFFDSDHVLEDQLGCSVREYFEQVGELAFRDLESSVLDRLSQLSQGVLATGGGSVLRGINRKILHDRTVVVYLRSHPEDLMKRLKNDQTRPLLQVTDPMQKLKDLFEARDPLYMQTAHFVIESSRPAVGMLASKIEMQLDMLLNQSTGSLGGGNP